jgi:hypothetical protein
MIVVLRVHLIKFRTRDDVALQMIDARVYTNDNSLAQGSSNALVELDLLL